MCDAMTKIIQITDIHITTPGNTIGGRDPIANFDRALEHALAQHGDAEAIFVTGDLSDWGDAVDYVHLRERLATVPLPVHLALGDHDERHVFARHFPDLMTDGFCQYRVDLKGHIALVLDTWAAGTHAGRFCEARAAWLDGQLGAADAPVLLFMHHNPVPLGLGPMDKIMQLDADRLGDVIDRHRGVVKHIFHGHCHLPLSGSFRGVPFSAPRGTNHAGWADFNNTAAFGSSDLPESYAVALIGDRDVMVHMIEFGYQANGGTIRSEPSGDKAEWDRLTMVR